MVGGMHSPEQRHAVHEPMHPVKIGILHDDHRNDASNEIRPAMEGNVGVDVKYPMHPPDPDRCPDSREDANRHGRMTDLPPDLTDRRSISADLSGCQSRPKKHPDEKEYRTGADQIAGEVARKDIWPDLAKFIED